MDIQPFEAFRIEVPDSERISWNSSLICELYPPSKFVDLAERLAAIGVSLDENPNSFQPAPRSSLGSGFRLLGFGHRRGDDRFPAGHEFEVAIPPGVEYIELSLHTVQPSLSALLIHFVFDREVRESVDGELRGVTPAGLIQVPMGHTLSTANIKAQQILAHREQVHLELWRYVEETFPGAFCSMDPDRSLSFDYFTALEIDADLDPGEVAPYARALGIDSSARWSNELLEPVAVHGLHSLEWDARPFVAAWLLAASAPQTWLEQTEMARMNQFSNALSGTAVARSVMDLLDIMHRALASSRDYIPDFSSSASTFINAVGEVESDLKRFRADIEHVAAPFLAESEDQAFCSIFRGHLLKPVTSHGEPELAEMWQRRLLTRARSLISDEERVDASIAASTELVSLRLQVELQRSAARFAKYAVAFAAVATLIGAAQLAVAICGN